MGDRDLRNDKRKIVSGGLEWDLEVPYTVVKVTLGRVGIEKGDLCGGICKYGDIYLDD